MSDYTQQCDEQQTLIDLKKNNFRITKIEECYNGTSITYNQEKTNIVREIILKTPWARKNFLTFV